MAEAKVVAAGSYRMVLEDVRVCANQKVRMNTVIIASFGRGVHIRRGRRRWQADTGPGKNDGGSGAQALRAHGGWFRHSFGGRASRDLNRQCSIKVKPATYGVQGSSEDSRVSESTLGRVPFRATRDTWCSHDPVGPTQVNAFHFGLWPEQVARDSRGPVRHSSPAIRGTRCIQPPLGGPTT
jgi:hypothetical protein